eukprot:8246910-Alexandrium_andersonii.AAC.1
MRLHSNLGRRFAVLQVAAVWKMQNRFMCSNLELRGSKEDFRVGFLSCRRVQSAALFVQMPNLATRGASGH